MNLDQKVLARIERENIRIRPRSFWALQSALAWIWACALEIAAALVLGMALLFAVKDQNWLAGVLLSSVFAILFYFGFRQFFQAGFEQFYKLGFAAVLVALFGVNGALGYFFWDSGQAEKWESQIRETPAYQKMEPALDLVFDPNDFHEQEEEKRIGGTGEREEKEPDEDGEDRDEIGEEDDDSREEKREIRSRGGRAEDNKDEERDSEDEEEKPRVRGARTSSEDRDESEKRDSEARDDDHKDTNKDEEPRSVREEESESD